LNHENENLTETQHQEILEQYRQAIRNAEAPDPDLYLADRPEEVREKLLIEFIKIDLTTRHTNDETLIIDDYLNRYPEHTELIRDLIATKRQVSTIMPPPAEAETGFAATIAPGSQTRSSSQYLPRQFGDYELLKEIARGGMGVVYLARQNSLKRHVALKMILSGELAGEQEVRRFYSEAEAAAHLDHIGIVPIYEVGQLDGQHFFSMGYIDGECLSDRVNDGPLPPQEAAGLVRQVADAISYAHQRGVIHRDLKPSNILMDKWGQPKVTDFGLAKKLAGDSSLTATGDVMGTPSYMPPEQAGGNTGNVGPLADVYSLGAVLYQLLIGRPPFQAATSIETIVQVLNTDPVAPRSMNASIPKDLETICLKCLEKDPHRRYQSAALLSEELQRFLDGEPIQARPVAAPARFWRWCKRKPLIAGLSAAVVISLLTGMSVSIYYRMVAEQRAERAEQGTRIALTTLESVINTVQEKLRNIPAAREIRQELLKNSMTDLKRLSGEVKSQGRVDLNTANVLVDLGLLFQEVGDDSGMNATSAAETNYKNAVAIFAQLANQADRDAAANVTFMRDHARALERLGNLYLDGNRTQLAKPFLKQALMLRREAAALNPNDHEEQARLVWSIVFWGDLFTSQRNFQKALEIYPEAETLAQNIVDDEPNKNGYVHTLGITKEKMGDSYHDLGQNDKAYKYFQQRFDLQKQLCDQEPDNLNLKYELSYAYERLGNHWLQVGDARKAKKMYQQMLAITQQALAADQENLELQDGLLVCYEKMIQVCSRLQQPEEVRYLSQQATTLRTKLARAQ